MRATRNLFLFAACAAVLIAPLALVACDTCGCQDAAAEKAVAEVPATALVKAEAALPPPALCGQCGQIKGSAVCCKDGAATCDKCGLAKDSPGCCKLPEKGKDALLCIKCGQIKGSDVCCKKDAVICDKCGLVKDSPACCNLPACKKCTGDGCKCKK